MAEITMQFTAAEASAILRALAIAKQKADSTEVRDDLEVLHGRVYDYVYRRPRKAGRRMQMGSVAPTQMLAIAA